MDTTDVHLERAFPVYAGIGHMRFPMHSVSPLRNNHPQSSSEANEFLVVHNDTINNYEVRLKREYLDQQALAQKKDAKVLTGEEWYVQQAARAVNQAVGRVIRHRHDYGAIIL